MREDANCQRIEIAPVDGAWVVIQGGKPLDRFDTVETAYQSALALCDELFERGVRSRVYELPQAA